MALYTSEQNQESQGALWNQLTRRRDLVGGTLVVYQRGAEVSRDEINGSRVLAGYPPGVIFIGKTGERIACSVEHSKIKKESGRYEIVCQPEGLDTYEVAVAPREVEIPKKPGIEESARNANSNQ